MSREEEIAFLSKYIVDLIDKAVENEGKNVNYGYLVHECTTAEGFSNVMQAMQNVSNFYSPPPGRRGQTVQPKLEFPRIINKNKLEQAAQFTTDKSYDIKFENSSHTLLPSGNPVEQARSDLKVSKGNFRVELRTWVYADGLNQLPQSLNVNELASVLKWVQNEKVLDKFTLNNEVPFCGSELERFLGGRMPTGVKALLVKKLYDSSPNFPTPEEADSLRNKLGGEVYEAFNRDYKKNDTVSPSVEYRNKIEQMSGSKDEEPLHQNKPGSSS